MFQFLKEKIKKVYNNVTKKAISLFSRSTIDEDFFKELTVLLISADTGITTTTTIIEHLKQEVTAQRITTPEEIRLELEKQLISILQNHKVLDEMPEVTLLVGINGSGKTTFAGKIAHKIKSVGKKVLLVAGDTFRAAATEQLQEWGTKIGVEVFAGKQNQDPASVIFDACKEFKAGSYDHLIVDTAGRLQTKSNLMKELEKIKRIASKNLPDKKIHTWLTVDSMLGQNSFEQAKIFNKATSLDGIILTKFDGTGKGGIVFSITKELHLPIVYVTFGENVEALKSFSPEEYVQELFSE
jgi:fused signal recognition particle receptor